MVPITHFAPSQCVTCSPRSSASRTACTADAGAPPWPAPLAREANGAQAAPSAAQLAAAARAVSAAARNSPGASCSSQLRRNAVSALRVPAGVIASGALWKFL